MPFQDTLDFPIYDMPYNRYLDLDTDRTLKFTPNEIDSGWHRCRNIFNQLIHPRDHEILECRCRRPEYYEIHRATIEETRARSSYRSYPDDLRGDDEEEDGGDSSGDSEQSDSTDDGRDSAEVSR